MGAIETVGRALGVGIANLVNIFNPQVVVIGGGVSEAGDLLLDPAREVVERRALAPAKDVVRIEAAAFGAEAGLIGAALMAREQPDGVPSAAAPAMRRFSSRAPERPTPDVPSPQAAPTPPAAR